MAPILYKDIITKRKITYDEIIQFNKYLLSIGNPEINYLIEPISILRYTPIDIVCKYWARIYTIECAFYKQLNNKLMNSEFKLYDIYIKTLYYGLESNSLAPNFNDKLFRGSIINKNEISKIINYKNQKVIVFCKAFLSFSKNIDIAVNFLKRSTKGDEYDYVFYELNTLEQNEIQNYNISNIELKDYSVFKSENEILFLPGSSFEIKEVQNKVNINGLNACKIILSYIGKFNEDFYEIYNNPNKILELTKNNEIITPIREYFFSDKDLFSFDNNDIEYLNNGKYILSKILINIDPHFLYYKHNKIHDENLKYQLKNTIFPTYLLKNRYNNNYYIANLFYKINIEKEVFNSNLDFVKNIENPYSLKCVDNFEDEDFYYVIYEYFDDTLENFVDKNRHKKKFLIPVNFIHKILTQINVSLEKMVKINKFHKDIKPGNIFIVYNNEEKDNFDIRLGGFNLSIDEEESNLSSCCAGDEYFRAPEALVEGDHKKCDLWSIGVLIYYLYFLRNLNRPFNFRKPDDPDLKYLTENLIVDVEERMDWNDYFSHPFFKKFK